MTGSDAVQENPNAKAINAAFDAYDKQERGLLTRKSYLVLREGQPLKCEKLSLSDTVATKRGKGPAKLTQIATHMSNVKGLNDDTQARFKVMVKDFLGKQFKSISKDKDSGQKAAELIEQFAPWQLAGAQTEIRRFIEDAVKKGDFPSAKRLLAALPEGPVKLD